MNTPVPSQPIKLKDTSNQIEQLRIEVNRILNREKSARCEYPTPVDLGVIRLVKLVFRRSTPYLSWVPISSLRPKWKVDEWNFNAHCQECYYDINRVVKNNIESVDDLFASLQKAVHEAYKLNHTSSPVRVMNASVNEEQYFHSRIKISEQESSSEAASPSASTTIKARGAPSSEWESKSPLRVRDVSPKTDRPVQSGQDIVPQMQLTRSDPEIAHIKPVEMRYHLDSGAEVIVQIPSEICRKLAWHCGESNLHRREVGGILVGTVEKVREANAVMATDLMEFSAASSSGSRLHLNHDSWLQVQQEFEHKYKKQGKNILGWYHTHPTQGIFFSHHDDDFHTTFSLPYQFALVIDPQSMNAGLLYWKNRERRELSHSPLYFSLLPQYELTEPVSTESSEQEVGDPSFDREEADLVKIIPAAALATVLVGYLLAKGLDWKSKSFNSDYACLIALIILAGLRIWNTRWLHSPQTIYARVASWHKSERDVDSVKNERMDGQHKATSFGKAAIYMVIFILVVGIVSAVLLGYIDFRRENKTPPLTEDRPNPGNKETSGTEASGRKSTPQKKEVLVYADSSGLTNATKITLKATDDKLTGQVIYTYAKIKQKKTKFGGFTCNSDEEKRFFKELLGWDIGKKEKYIESFQKNANLNGPNGLWGPFTRTAFVQRVLQAAKNSNPLELLSPSGEKITIVFVRPK